MGPAEEMDVTLIRLYSIHLDRKSFRNPCRCALKSQSLPHPAAPCCISSETQSGPLLIEPRPKILRSPTSGPQRLNPHETRGLHTPEL